MAKKGAPTKYRDEYDEQARKLCLLGYTDSQLGDFFGVTEQTINNWKKDHPSFFESLKKGKALADAEVADSFYHRALGYSHDDVHISNYQGEITITPTVKHYPPDTAAGFIWLKNRAGWKDRKESSEEHERTIEKLDEVLSGISKSME